MFPSPEYRPFSTTDVRLLPIHRSGLPATSVFRTDIFSTSRMIWISGKSSGISQAIYPESSLISIRLYEQQYSKRAARQEGVRWCAFPTVVRKDSGVRKLSVQLPFRDMMTIQIVSIIHLPAFLQKVTKHHHPYKDNCPHKLSRERYLFRRHSM